MDALGQRLFGTFRDQFAKMQSLLGDMFEEELFTPGEYQATLLHILKSIEGLRVKNENELQRLREQTKYYEAVIKSCSMLGSLVIGIVESRTRERLKIIDGYKFIERKALAEDKARVVEFRASGKNDEADKLEEEIKYREEELNAKEELERKNAESLRKQEGTITAKTVQNAHSEFSTPPGREPGWRNRSDEQHITDTIEETLKDAPIVEKDIIQQIEKRARKSRKSKS